MTRIRSRSVLFSVLVVLLFLAFAFQLWYHALRTGPTIDEPTHVLAGHRYWACGDFGINPEHPPLTKLLATVSLNSRTLTEPAWPCGSRLTRQAEEFKAGAQFLIDNGVDDVLIPARLLAALLSLLLAALVAFTALKMFGPWEAIAALAILAFEPNLIAHGSLVTTDMAVTLGALAAAFTLHRYSKEPTWPRFIISGLAVGLPLTAKHSAVVLVPILFAVFIIDVLVFHSGTAPRVKHLLRRTAAFTGALLIGIVILWASYGFRYHALPSTDASPVSIAGHIQEYGPPDAIRSTQAKVVLFVAGLHILPESYVLGLADVVAQGSRITSIFDRNYATGRWFYFPLAFLVKSSIPLLLLLPLGIALPFFAADKRREMLFLLGPPVLFFAVSLTSGLNIGVRHMLPVYPFFIIVAAAGAVWVARRVVWFRCLVIVLFSYHMVTAVRTAPNYIPFSNDLWGGTDNTYRIFPVDSNLDWGQNDKLVATYLAREGIKDCWYAGWGNAELMKVLQPCRMLPGTFPQSDLPLDPAVPPVIEGTILVNAANLPPRGGDEYAQFVGLAPVKQIGGSIFVYRGRFEIPLAAAVSHAQRATQLVTLGRIDEALTDARRSVAPADGDPRTHLALGLAYAASGNKAGAHAEFNTVIEAARSNRLLFRNVEGRARYELQKLGP